MEVKPGEAAETLPEPPTTGGNPRKEQARWDGTVTVTDPALDVGVNRAEPTPAAATPGWGAEAQILQTRALQTQAPTGATLKPILRTVVRAGVSP